MSCYSKKIIRKELASIRKDVSQERRACARAALTKELYPLLKGFRSILSFYSLPQEIDISDLNQILCDEGRLVLPKVEGDRLDLFYVEDIDQQLGRISWNCLEPIPEKCRSAALETIDCVLVPALGFDDTKMRIGYGKGYYDRLITAARKASQKTHFIGIGFHEQLSARVIPFEAHDQALDELFLT